MSHLFSVIVLCYRHFEYTFSAIDSVLMQDYPNIELIVSDDGSDNFPKEKLECYIAKRKGNNITNVVVRQQKKNGGTVKHLNSAVKSCNGRYIIALAGDDNLYDRHVLSNYVRGFAEAPTDCAIEMAQTAMFDENMETLQEYYMTPDVQRAIEKTETDSGDLLRLLIRYGACLPSTSTCFTAEFFRKYGDFDESYTLVEDYPMHVRLAEEGWIIHSCNFIAIKHRSGGISHGQSDTLSRSARMYYEDSERMIENLMLSKQNYLRQGEKEPAMREVRRNLQWVRIRLAVDGGIKNKLTALLTSPEIVIEKMLYGLAIHTGGILRKLPVLVICLWLGIPLIASMANTLVTGAGESLRMMMYIFAAFSCLLWIVLLLLLCLCQSCEQLNYHRGVTGTNDKKTSTPPIPF